MQAQIPALLEHASLTPTTQCPPDAAGAVRHAAAGTEELAAACEAAACGGDQWQWAAEPWGPVLLGSSAAQHDRDGPAGAGASATGTLPLSDCSALNLVRQTIENV